MPHICEWNSGTWDEHNNRVWPTGIRQYRLRRDVTSPDLLYAERDFEWPIYDNTLEFGGRTWRWTDPKVPKSPAKLEDERRWKLLSRFHAAYSQFSKEQLRPLEPYTSGHKFISGPYPLPEGHNGLWREPYATEYFALLEGLLELVWE